MPTITVEHLDLLVNPFCPRPLIDLAQEYLGSKLRPVEKTPRSTRFKYLLEDYLAALYKDPRVFKTEDGRFVILGPDDPECGQTAIYYEVYGGSS